MTTQSLDELEGALERVTRRLSASATPVPGAAQRVARLEREPWRRLAWTGTLIAVSLVNGQYGLAGALLLLALPYKVAKVRQRRDQIELLHSSGDLLALEVKSLTDRHSRLGTSAALALWFGSLFAVVGLFSPRPLVGLGAGALALLGALFILLRVRPRLRRALADLGAEPKDTWLAGHFVVLLFVFFPVILLVALVRSRMGWDRDDAEAEAAKATNDVGNSGREPAEQASDANTGLPSQESHQRPRAEGEESQ
jgi:hypothetical protein